MLISSSSYIQDKTTIKYLESINKNPELFYLGSICKRQHNFNNLGYSIRTKNDRNCIECKALKYLVDKENISKRRKKHDQENKDVVLARVAEYRKTNPEKLKDTKKREYRKNKAKYAETGRKNRIEKPELYSARKKQYRLENSEIIKQQSQAAYIRQKSDYIYRAGKRRAIKNMVKIGKIRPKDILELKAKFDNKCAYCDTCLETVVTHLDHVVPLSKGGSHSLNNLVPSCSHCNLSKHDRLLDDWYKRQEFFSDRNYRKTLEHIGAIVALKQD